MQLLKLILAIALFGAAHAQQLQSPPSFFILAPGSSESNPTKIFLNASQVYYAAVGSNITLGCQYTDASWRTSIGKWSMSPANTVFLPLYENGYASFAYSDVVNRYPALDLRVDGGGYFSNNPVIVYLRLIKIMQYDVGTYGCYSNFGSSKSTSYANITIAVNSSDLYGVRMVSIDQQINIDKPMTGAVSVATPYSCTIFRGKDTNYTMWFDKCLLSQVGQDLSYATRTLNCKNMQSALTYGAGVGNQYANGVGLITKDVNKPVVADMYPMTTGPGASAVFWQKNLYTDTYSISLSADAIYASPNGWLNMSLACFAYRNTSNSLMQDYITFAQTGVDLDVDPSVISCTRHHYVAAPGSAVQFFCIVQQPFYRGDASISWEIWQASKAGGPYNTVSIVTQADVNGRGWGKLVQVVDSTTTTATVGGAQQRQIGTGLNVTVDTATTVNWRFRLVVSYTTASTSRSDFFSVATSDGTGLGGSGAKPGPQTGASRSGAETPKSCFMLISAVAAISLLFMSM